MVFYDFGSRARRGGTLAALLCAGLLATSASEAGASQLTASPASGAPGDRVTLAGAGFDARSAGRLSFGGRRLRAVRAGRGGHFRVQIRVPAGAAGRVRVAATLRGSTARTTFRRRQPKPGKGMPATPTTPPTPATPTAPTTGTDTTSGAWWRPAVDATWQIQLSGRLDTSVDAQVYDIDGVDAPAATVAALRAAGRRTVCYLSAGSYEDWRPDAKSFPAAVLGSSNGWPGERWLDIRRLDVLGPILAARMDACKAKGFDAVDPDNVDGYANRTGFPLTAADQLAFNRWLADAAHARGLGVGLKNDLDQASALVASFDFAVNEQCVQYRECDALTPFVRTGKPVFGIEYSGTAATVCAEAQRLGLRTVRKALALDAPRTTCW
jgi:hypothetical protein